MRRMKAGIVRHILAQSGSLTVPNHGRRLDGRFDYIIVGAGTAGCVLANRLTEDPGTRVLLLEAGGSDNYHWVHIPVGYLYCIGNPRTDWMMKTAVEAGLNGRSLAYPRGKLLGGCSSINGMIYMRGQAADYDRWRQMGNIGWGWDDVLPYFRKSEDHHSGEAARCMAPAANGRSRSSACPGTFCARFRRAPRSSASCPAPTSTTATTKAPDSSRSIRGRGCAGTPRKGFLRPAMRRPNLRVITRAQTEGLIFDGKTATGVRFRWNGRLHEATAEAEVLLAAGAINSPKILEHSGIGRPDLLCNLGIDVVHGSPGVGENLQDHLQIRTVFRVSNAKTLNTMLNSPLGKARVALQYALTRTGPMSMAPSQFGMFTKSDPSMATPNLEYHVQPLSTERLGDPLHPFPAITVSVCNLRPESVGSVHVRDTDLDRQPDIRLNYLSTEADRRVAVQAVRQARQIMTARALASYRPVELLPGPAHQSDDDLLKQIGDIATTIFHPVGTCKMGRDERAVVGTDLRVHGVDRLRAIDASIMPTIVSGNTASPVVMIAEKAADMIWKGVTAS